MLSLPLLRLRFRASVDLLVTLAIMLLAAVLVVGYQVLRLLGRPGGRWSEPDA